MAEYIITSKEPAWRFEPHDLLHRIQRQWPNARTAIPQALEDPAAAEALIPFDPPRRELGIALGRQCRAIYLDPADPETAAEFAGWFGHQLPTLEPPTYLFTMNLDVQMPLGPDTTQEQILTVLRNRQSTAGV